MVTPYGLTKEDRDFVKEKCKQILYECRKPHSDGAYIGEKAKKILDTCRS